jgi:PAS domain-containing protein
LWKRFFIAPTTFFRQFEPRSMIASQPTANDIVGIALSAAYHGNDGLHAVLGLLPAPIYATDAEGWVTFFNQPCVDFAGRTPRLGEDRWCVTWKLFSESGEHLPHEECPMAVAIREKRPVRGAVAVAERPDGRRVCFTPYPTPLIDEQGEVSGAVNILVDITGRREALELREQAGRCRLLAGAVRDPKTAAALELMAGDCEARARRLGG